jgi:hypothetical protein
VEPKLMALGTALKEVMVGFAAFTVKLRETGAPAAQVPLPACEAWIVHVPGVRNVAVVPLTVQTPVVSEANVSVKPELAVADSVRGVPTVCASGALKVIVCGSGSTVKLRDTGDAAAQVPLPTCEAWIVQVPALTKVVTKTVAVEPLTVQTPVVWEAKLTAKPELAVAESVSSALAVWVPGALNVIVCGCKSAAFTLKLRETGTAAAQVPLPACEAWIVQAPDATKVAIMPLTVQTPVVSEANVTVKPELAVADSFNGVPIVCVAGALNVIVCGCSWVSVTFALPVRSEAVALITTVGKAGIVVGAVNKPVALIVPAEADHVTPGTAVVNCSVPPSGTLTLRGDTAIGARWAVGEIAVGVGVTMDWPARPVARKIETHNNRIGRRKGICEPSLWKSQFMDFPVRPLWGTGP